MFGFMEGLTPAAVGVASVGAVVTSSTTLTPGSAGYQPVAMTALGQSITLPLATALSEGGPLYIIDNTLGEYPLGVRDSTGTLLTGVAAGGEAYVSLRDNSTAAGSWSVTGTKLEPGLTLIDYTFSSTYLSAELAPFVALDANTSIHFAKLASGFAAFIVDNLGKVLTTPVTVTATASSVPVTAFRVSDTSAIIFFGASTTDHQAVVLTVSGSSPSLSLAVGTPQALTATTSAAWGGENFSGAPKIAQLSSTLYLASYVASTNTPVVAISVSGAVITIGAAVNITSATTPAGGTTTYALTATTALVLYKTGSAGNWQNKGVVISVSGTTCTVGTPATLTGVGSLTSTGTPPPSCLLSPTKCLVLADNIVSGQVIVGVFTVAGTTVTAGTPVTVETGITPELLYTTNSATRYNPHLAPLSANTGLLWYLDSSDISRAVVLTEAAGVVAAGTILYGSISKAATTANESGVIFPQGTTEFLSLKQSVGAASSFQLRVVPHKISGTAVTVGAGGGFVQDLDTLVQANSQTMTRLASGDYLILPNTSSQVTGIPVFRANGDSVSARGSIKIPAVARTTGMQGVPGVTSNRIIVLGSTKFVGSTVSAGTYQLRLLNVEIAA